MKIIPAADYEREMKETVLPYLEERRKSGTFERVADQKLYYEAYEADEPKGTVVIVHGFSEAIDKFYETVWYFLQNGFNVWQLQQREHGRSWRSTKKPELIYIPDYRYLVEDLRYFTVNVVKKAACTAELPLYLFAHSMGGGVSACYLEKYPDDYTKAILSSPMLEMNSGSTPSLAAAAFARAMVIAGKGQDSMPGAQPFSGKEDFENSCSNCLERYRHWFRIQKEHPEYQMCVPAIRTALEFLHLTRAATSAVNTARVKASVLLFQAAHDTMVKPKGQENFIRQIGEKGRLVRMENAKHEIYLGTDEDLKKYWDEILAFLNS